MKRLLTLVLTVILANVAIQTKAASADAERKAKAQVSRLSQQLSLTQEQQDKLLPIATEFFTEKENINTAKQSGENKRQAQAELQRNTEAKVKAVLTAEQFTKWKALQKENADKKATKTK